MSNYRLTTTPQGCASAFLTLTCIMFIMFILACVVGLRACGKLVSNVELNKSEVVLPQKNSEMGVGHRHGHRHHHQTKNIDR
jgi:hypothetical protein